MAVEKAVWDRKWQRGRVILFMKSGLTMSFVGGARCKRSSVKVEDYDVDTGDEVLLVPNIGDLDGIMVVRMTK